MSCYRFGVLEVVEIIIHVLGGGAIIRLQDTEVRPTGVIALLPTGYKLGRTPFPPRHLKGHSLTVTEVAIILIGIGRPPMR